MPAPSEPPAPWTLGIRSIAASTTYPSLPTSCCPWLPPRQPRPPGGASRLASPTTPIRSSGGPSGWSLAACLWPRGGCLRTSTLP
eukprot:8432945-Lingulodinium_polyedra.AAC.1